METKLLALAFTRLGVILCASDNITTSRLPGACDSRAVVRRGNNIDEFEPLELDVIHNIMSKRCG